MKIAIVGGGSYNWCPTVLTELFLSASLNGSELSLMDFDKEALGLIEQMADLFQAKLKTSWKVKATQSMDEAMKGADYVLVCISTGGFKTMKVDLQVPEKYGIFQTVGDTVGPGGLSRALRNIPVFLDMAKKMETLCPNAWMLNVTNPLSVITRTVNKVSSIRAIGLCHGVSSQAHAYACTANGGPVDMAKVQYTTTGVDHFSWITRLSVTNEDGIEKIRQKGFCRSDGKFPWEVETQDDHIEAGMSSRVGFAMWKEVGYLPGISDRHLVEFLPNFLNSKETLEKYGVKRTLIEHREANKEKRKHRIIHWLEKKEEMDFKAIGGHEGIAELIEALEGARILRTDLNVPNEGQIPQLPLGAVVEIVCTVDKNGVHPEMADMPLVLEMLVRPHVIRQELTVEAGVAGNFELAVNILATDPTLNSVTHARPMLTEMLQGTKDYLPQFKKIG